MPLLVRAGETGRLFGAVTPSDIVTAVEKAGGPPVDKHRIEVTNPIKTVGAHTVTPLWFDCTPRLPRPFSSTSSHPDTSLWQRTA